MKCKVCHKWQHGKEGRVAGVARKAPEAEKCRPLITAQNAESFRQLVTDIVTDAAQLPEQMEENANGK